MTKKLRGCRPIDDINNEYSQTCGLLGDRTHRRASLAKEIEKFNQRLAELDLEAGAAKQQMEAIAAEDAAKHPEENNEGDPIGGGDNLPDRGDTVASASA